MLQNCMKTCHLCIGKTARAFIINFTESEYIFKMGGGQGGSRGCRVVLVASGKDGPAAACQIRSGRERCAKGKTRKKTSKREQQML